jgi:hypothetical protein
MYTGIKIYYVYIIIYIIIGEETGPLSLYIYKSVDVGNVNGDFLHFFIFFMYVIQHSFIGRPLDFTVSDAAGTEPRL